MSGGISRVARVKITYYALYALWAFKNIDIQGALILFVVVAVVVVSIYGRAMLRK